ncbi:MAG: 50S ribosomal protein L17, partial [Blastochloris sp.]|nr:50S ribosomal protein L17 [Blastochloris sp.]
MRHRVRGQKMGRSTKHRLQLRTALANALIEHERIETTEAKASFVRDYVEKLIT